MAMGLFLVIGGASNRVMASLNRAGLCVSARTVDRVRVVLSEDAMRRAQEVFNSQRLFSIVFDNINIYVRHFDQRVDNQNSMINAINIALVELPGGAEPEGEDVQARLDMRGKRSEDRDGACIELTAADGKHMDKAFTAIIAKLLCAHWPNRDTWSDKKAKEAEMAKITPNIRPLPPQKTTTFLMGVVDVDEGSKKGIMQVFQAILVISSLVVEAFVSKIRLIIGDLRTIQNLRGARRDHADDISRLYRMEHIQELSALFHWVMNAIHMLVRTHLGNLVQDPGSLSNHKDLLGRVRDVNKPDYAAAKSLIRHSLIARLLHIVMYVPACEGNHQSSHNTVALFLPLRSRKGGPDGQSLRSTCHLATRSRR